MKIMSIAGARPNFMKLAAISQAIRDHNDSQNKDSSNTLITHIIVHTGQHYDEKMSKQFFQELEIPLPDVNLGVGSGSHAAQTAEIMKRFESVILEIMPDILLLVGDVNSTIACALVASKINYPAEHKRRRPAVVHVEAGLRSFDRSMPEEINRIVTDSLSDLLFVTEPSGVKNLLAEGVSEDKINFVGNVMVDTLFRHLKKATLSKIKIQLKITPPYGLVTLHRPSNVDSKGSLWQLADCLVEVARSRKIVFPVHPRTSSRMDQYGVSDVLADNHNITITGPLGYLDFLNLLQSADFVLTDSGGLQEETTALKVPCITLRENTERPVTVTEGTNYLTGVNPTEIKKTVQLIIEGDGKESTIPKFWDGKAAQRIIDSLINNIKVDA